ncbi:MAG: FMN-binding protein [Gammaproteobacteria bacterium]|nr:MAG: FMN-binding protein [Gammaproteobacteria bacterium]
MNSKKLHPMRLILGVLLFLIAFSVSARGVYQSNQDFLDETFEQVVPKSKVIWVKGDVRQTLSELLGHPYQGMRVRYWQQQAKSVWVLDEIGKTEAITFGIVIVANKIDSMKVLAFRESRGGEIRYPAFTQQFNGAQLQGQQLDRHIDGVSGATLSVRAMTSVAEVALYLDNIINQ